MKVYLDDERNAPEGVDGCENWMYRLQEWADDDNIDEKVIPREISKLTQLTKLCIGNRNLIEFPKEIGQLAQLKVLFLNSYILTALPKEICQLTQLIELNLRNNNLALLPKEIGQLTQLTRLALDNNAFTKLPKEIVQLTQLTELELNISNPTLVLTQEQKDWIEKLIDNGCNIIGMEVN